MNFSYLVTDNTLGNSTTKHSLTIVYYTVVQKSGHPINSMGVRFFCTTVYMYFYIRMFWTTS